MSPTGCRGFLRQGHRLRPISAKTADHGAALIMSEMHSVANDKSELETIRKRLSEVSRVAALGEVATGVLHNVGNVLNSVNVSVTLLSDNLKKSRFSDVSRIAELMRAHKDDLTSFLPTYAKGQPVTDFLTQLPQNPK